MDLITILVMFIRSWAGGAIIEPGSTKTWIVYPSQIELSGVPDGCRVEITAKVVKE